MQTYTFRCWSKATSNTFYHECHDSDDAAVDRAHQLTRLAFDVQGYRLPDCA
jgi:hypothetical protein